MNRFLKYIFMVCFLTGIVSAGWFHLVNLGLKKQQSDYFGKLNELFYGKQQLDVVFFGSSRVNWTVNPAIIDSIGNCSSFNFGLDGAYLVEDGFLIDSYLKSHSMPRCLVVTVDPKMLKIGNEIKTPARFLPYLDVSMVYDTLDVYSTWPSTVRFLPFIGGSYYDDGIIFQSLRGAFFKNTPMQNYYKGFSPLEKTWDHGDESMEGLLKPEITSKGLILLDDFLGRLTRMNVPVLLVYAPQYRDSRYSDWHSKYLNVIRKVSTKFNVPFIDYCTLELCTDKSFFFDATHLNKKGANEYSRILGLDVRRFCARSTGL